MSAPLNLSSTLPLRLFKATVVLTFLVLLSGCYLPVRFDAEIELDKRGYYSMIFDGYLADLDLYNGLRTGEIFPLAENEEADKVLRDLQRDGAVKQSKYMKKGIFYVNWENKGDLFRNKMITFIRRNEAMLTLSYVKKTGVITLTGKGISSNNKKRLVDAGLNMTGTIRFVTPINVASHNATKVYDSKLKPGYKVYAWDLKSLNSPTPKLEIRLK